MAERIIDILGSLADSLNIRVITPEYQIALFLLDRAHATAEELLRNSCLSSTGFFNTLDRLKHWGIVVYDQSPDDRRCKLYKLSDNARRLIIGAFQRYRTSRSGFTSFLLNQSSDGFSPAGGGESRLDHLTCEYQILLYLYLSPGMRNSDLLKLVDASDTKFNMSLSRLAGMGLVEFDHDAGDKRRKNYRISAQVERILDETNQRIFRWLAVAEREKITLNVAGGNRVN